MPGEPLALQTTEGLTSDPNGFILINECHYILATPPLSHFTFYTARLHLRLLRSSVTTSRSWRPHRTPFLFSLGACPNVVSRAYKRMWSTQTTKYHFQLLQLRFSKMDLLATFFFIFGLSSVGWSFDLAPWGEDAHEKGGGKPRNFKDKLVINVKKHM